MKKIKGLILGTVCISLLSGCGEKEFSLDNGVYYREIYDIKFLLKIKNLKILLCYFFILCYTTTV